MSNHLTDEGGGLGTLVKPQLAQAGSEESVSPRMEDLSNLRQEDTASIALLCNKGNALSVLYFATVTPYVEKIARVIGTIIYGTSLPCRVIRLIRGDLRCLNRCNGTLQMMNSAKRMGRLRA